MGPYTINVWNRTDLSANGGIGLDYSQLGAANATQNYIGQVKGLLDTSGSNTKYRGEVIPAYAVMRVAGPMEWIDDKPTFPVALPDDVSQAFQQAGCHFFNGPTPIPVDGIGQATQNLPAQALIDMTHRAANQTYGLTPKQFMGQNTFSDIALSLGIMSGAWALHDFNDVISINLSVLNQWPTFFPYSLISYVPTRQLDKKGKLQYTQPYAMVGSGGKIYVWSASEIAPLLGS